MAPALPLPEGAVQVGPAVRTGLSPAGQDRQRRWEPRGAGRGQRGTGSGRGAPAAGTELFVDGARAGEESAWGGGKVSALGLA